MANQHSFRRNSLHRKPWYKYTQSNGFRSFKLKLRQLAGIEPKFKKDIDLVTQNYPGWVIAPELLDDDDVVYSVGICNDIDFELGIIEQHHVQLFAFDPTPYSVKWIEKQTLPANFNFFPWAAAGSNGSFYLYPRINNRGKISEVMYTFHSHEEQRDDGVKVDAYTIESVAKKLGHSKIDLLKIDIEGAEYEVFNSLLNSPLRPKQILVEFHHRFKGIGANKTVNAIKALHENGYLIAHISATGREMSFVYKKALTQNKPSTSAL